MPKNKHETEDVTPEITEQDDVEQDVAADPVQELSDECDKLKDQLLRAQAELQNYRKRVEREKNDIYRFANEKYLADFLNVVDTIERAKVMMIDTTDTVTVSDGIELIQKQIQEFLARQGVVPIEALDQPFDHNLHHAVLSEESDKGEGIVLEELQKGYTLNDKILRPSMVKVSK